MKLMNSWYIIYHLLGYTHFRMKSINPILYLTMSGGRISDLQEYLRYSIYSYRLIENQIIRQTRSPHIDYSEDYHIR